jgi:UDP-N-acetylmuramyl pentapeptide synthase
VTLKEMRATRRIAVLGDMMELGEYSTDAHRAIGEQCAGVDVFVAVGRRMRTAAEEAKKSGVPEVRLFEKSEDAGAWLSGMITRGDVVLLKGSQAVRIERTTQALLKDPTRASELLARQGKEWQRR